MREILFKAKRIDNGEWVEGDLLQNYGHPKIREHESEIKAIVKSYAVQSETISQFTGLTDKNGTKIFEGDVINVAIENHCNGEVERYFNCYIKFCETTQCNGYYGIDDRNVLNRIPHIKEYLEIIGNIHDEAGE